MKKDCPQELTPLQRLQLDTGLSSAICQKLLWTPPEVVNPKEPEEPPEYTGREIEEIIESFEKIPVSLCAPILKIMMKCVFKLVSIHG